VPTRAPKTKKRFWRGAFRSYFTVPSERNSVFDKLTKQKIGVLRNLTEQQFCVPETSAFLETLPNLNLAFPNVPGVLPRIFPPCSLCSLCASLFFGNADFLSRHVSFSRKAPSLAGFSSVPSVSSARTLLLF